MYEELDIPESDSELGQRGSTPRAETNGSARAGSGHPSGQSNGKSEADLVVLGCHLVDFWINIVLCQSLIVEAAEDDGPPIYQVWKRTTWTYHGLLPLDELPSAWAAPAQHGQHKPKPVCMHNAVGEDRASYVLICSWLSHGAGAITR